MKKTPYFTLAVSTLVVLVMLGCSLTPGTGIPPDEQPGPVSPTDTPEIVLPPPAAAFLRVVYNRGGDLWLWTEGGSTIQLTYGGNASDPLLSSDGLLVAFKRSGELWVVNADGSGERVLVDSASLAPLLSTPGDSIEVNDILWYPSTHILLFNTLVVAGEAGYRIPRADLLSTLADASPAVMIQLRAPGDGGVPYVSPDLSTIALAQAGKVIFLEQSGAFLSEALTFDSALTYSEWAYVPELVWLADSSAVRLVVPAHDPLLDPSQVSTFWNVPVGGSASILATFTAAPVFASFPYISPDGEAVAYLAEDPINATIHTITSSGVDLAYASFPRGEVGLTGWSADSVHFMYWTPDGREVYLAGPGIDMRLGDTPHANSVSWVDASRYLYLNDGELRFTALYAPSQLLDSGVAEFDWGLIVY